MKKIICLLIMILLLSGCTATYNVRIDGNVVEETTYLIQQKNEKALPDSMIDDEYNTNTAALTYSREDLYTFTKLDGTDYYAKERIKTKSENGIKFGFVFNKDNYTFSKLANYCYENLTATLKENIYIIETSDKFSCFNQYKYLDKVIINISAEKNMKAVENNADKYDRVSNTYTWEIDKNKKDQSIKITFEKNATSTETKNKALSIWPLIIGILVTGAIGFVAYIIYNKAKNSNSI